MTVPVEARPSLRPPQHGQSELVRLADGVQANPKAIPFGRELDLDMARAIRPSRSVGDR